MICRNSDCFDIVSTDSCYGVVQHKLATIWCQDKDGGRCAPPLFLRDVRSCNKHHVLVDNVQYVYIFTPGVVVGWRGVWWLYKKDAREYEEAKPG